MTVTTYLIIILFIGFLLIIFEPILSMSDFEKITYNYKKQTKLRVIKIIKNNNTIAYEVQHKMKLCHLFPFYKWYSLSEREDMYATVVQYDLLEDAENRIKKLIDEINERNIKKYNNTIKKIDVIMITK